MAGPVVAAAVILPEDFALGELNDSKKLTPARREKFFEVLTSHGEVVYSVATVAAEEIDRINILRATHLAMRRAVKGLSAQPGLLLVDGLPVPDLPRPQQAVVGGDGLSFSIAAASVLAKVVRDRIMLDYDRQFPQYGFASHKGYGTRLHLEQLHRYGPTPIHRRSFAPVARLCAPGTA